MSSGQDWSRLLKISRDLELQDHYYLYPACGELARRLGAPKAARVFDALATQSGQHACWFEEFLSPISPPPETLALENREDCVDFVLNRVMIKSYTWYPSLLEALEDKEPRSSKKQQIIDSLRAVIIANQKAVTWLTEISFYIEGTQVKLPYQRILY
jgi:rubrerythrin